MIFIADDAEEIVKNKCHFVQQYIGEFLVQQYIVEFIVQVPISEDKEELLAFTDSLTNIILVLW